MMNMIVLDGYTLNPGDLSWEPLKALGSLTIYPRTAPNEVVERCKDAQIVFTNKVVLNAQILQQLPALKYIGVLATGYNVVDIQAAREQGIAVTNIPAYSTASVAQSVFAHLLNICNRTGHYAQEVKEGKWSTCPDFCYWNTPLMELSGKTIGIIGLGHTGQATARVAQGFGMKVKVFTSKPSFTLTHDYIKTDLDTLLSTSDVVSLHCPLTPTTHHLINATRLEQMKPGAILINTGRGPLVDDNDVAAALTSGHLGAYGADVTTTEPIPANSPLLQAPNAFLTPHIAWATFEARQRLMAICVDNVKAFLNSKPQNIVNP